MIRPNIIYPKCANSFKIFLSNNNLTRFYYNLGNPEPFDVTLRDGLQGLSRVQQENYSIQEKIDLYHKILFNYKPKNIEVGSLVSQKVLPIFKDSIDLFEKINEFQDFIVNNNNKEKKQNIFLLIPNKEKLMCVIDNKNLYNFSFITSVSNSFQLKNTKMSIDESDKVISNMLQELDNKKDKINKSFVKLYVSCINECPIEGKIDNDYIVYRILHLNKMNVDTICLSDTCGSLDVDDFEYIVDTCYYFGLPYNKISLHLHVQKGREDIVEQIIHKALDRKIANFDVSALETGGCSVTMDKNKLATNLSYELYYKSLITYMKKMCK